MCAVRTKPDAHRQDALPPAIALQLSRLSPRRAAIANDNRSPQAGAWRTAGALCGAAIAGCAALAVALVGV